MNGSLFRNGKIALVTLLNTAVCADPVPQTPMVLTQGLQGTFNADWEGVEGRTYFMQFSMDLEIWHYAPFIHFGDGGHHRGIESDAVKFFVRLHHGDFPGINRLEDAMNADFDGDGLSNIFEVTFGYDPFQETSTIDGPDASLDPDEDGLGNASEEAVGSDPIAKDNGLVNLEVAFN
jgi:hypothetical protein